MPRWSLTALLVAAAAGAAWLALRGPLPATGAGGPWYAAPGGGIAALIADPLPEAAPGCLEVETALYAPAVTPGEATWGLVTVRGASQCGATALPVDLALVMDTSGSMRSWGKLTEAKAAALALADALGPDDRVSLTTFDDGARVVADLSADTSRLRAAVPQLEADGSTFLEAGLLAGLGTLGDVPGRVPRVLLLTDGRATAGTLDAAGLARLAGGHRAAVSAVGVGEDYDETVLTAMADAGRGAYHYVERGADLPGLYLAELDRARHLAVRDGTVLLQVRGASGLEVLGGPSAEAADGLRVQVGDLAAGEERKLVVRLTPEGRGTTGLTAVATGADPVTAAPWAERAAVVAAIDAKAAAVAPIDPRVGAAVAHAQAGLAVERAREAWTRGDDAGARRVIAEAAAQTRSVADTIPEALHALGYLDDVGSAPSADIGAKRASEASRDLVR